MANRELKFRFWSIHYEEFVDGLFISQNGRIFGRKSEDSNIEDWSDCYITQQFTENFDKNGKEIYEGDILIDDNSEILIVKWDKAEFLGHYNFQFVRLNGEKYCYYGSMGNLDEKEIIGNIFENPELLNETK